MIIVKAQEFTSALAKISAFVASSNPNVVSGVMLDISDNSLKIGFSDSTKSIIEEIECDASDEAIKGKIVTPYKRLVDIINGCQPKGGIRIDDITIEIKGDMESENNILNFTVNKRVRYNAKNSDADEAVERASSVISQSTSWCSVDANKKVGLLKKGDYDSIFNAEEGTQFDVWDCKELKEILTRTSTESGKTSYILSDRDIGFVANLVHVSVIPISEHSIIVSLPSAIAKSIIDFIGKLDSSQDKLYLRSVDNRRLYAFTEDRKVGFWTDMAPANRTHISYLTQYMSRNYTKYQLTFNREALQDAIESALASGKDQKTSIEFGDSTLEEGKIEMRIKATDSAASVSNNYGLLCWSCVDTVGDIKSVKLSVSLKVLADMVSNCNSFIVGIDISEREDDNIYMRVAEIDSDKREEAHSELLEKLGLTEGQPIPESESVLTREKTLMAKHYNVSK